MQINPLSAESVRRYRKEIARFYYENVRSNSCYGHYTYDEAYEKIADFIGHLENGTCIGYGLFDGDEICGFIWAYPHPFREENRMYVNEIRVREDHRHKGYGKALLKQVEECTKEMGITVLYLHAEANNPEAIHLYERCGYLQERIQMRKKLE